MKYSITIPAPNDPVRSIPIPGIDPIRFRSRTLGHAGVKEPTTGRESAGIRCAIRGNQARFNVDLQCSLERLRQVDRHRMSNVAVGDAFHPHAFGVNLLPMLLHARKERDTGSD